MTGDARGRAGEDCGNLGISRQNAGLGEQSGDQRGNQARPAVRARAGAAHPPGADRAGSR